jgi:hypothetical protein
MLTSCESMRFKLVSHHDYCLQIADRWYQQIIYVPCSMTFLWFQDPYLVFGDFYVFFVKQYVILVLHFGFPSVILEWCINMTIHTKSLWVVSAIIYGLWFNNSDKILVCSVATKFT